MALNIQPINLGDNFRTWRDRFNVLVGYMNHTLQDTNNLSDLLNKETARVNLDVWSRQQATNLFLDTASNLGEISANGEKAREAARINIDVFSRTQTDARYYEESKLMSEVSGTPNAASRDTLHTNIDVYRRGVVWTRAESDDRFFQVDASNASPDNDINDHKRGGTYAMTTAVAGSGTNGTVVSLSPNGSGRYQIYAPHKENVTDVLSGVNLGDKSAMFIRSGWGSDLKGWEQLVTSTMADATYFRKNLLLGELNGAARNTDRRTLTNNIDVYQKGDVFTKTESDVNFYRKNVLWNRTESDARFFQVTNDLIEIKNRGAAALAASRGNLDVYSKSESETRYINDDRANMFSELAGSLNMSVAQREKMMENLGVYSRAKIDSDYQTGASTYLARNSNLSDLTDTNDARTNLGLGNTSTRNFSTINDTWTVSGSSNDIARGDHKHAALTYTDTRTLNALPNSLPVFNGKNYELKNRSVILGSGVGSMALETSSIAADYQATARTHQLAYDGSAANGRIHHRVAASATTWGAFKTLAYLDDTVADSDKLNGQSPSFYLDWNNTTNKPSIAAANHNHNTTYLGLTAKAADSSGLDGSTKAQVIAEARRGYLTTSGKAADSFKLEGLTKAQVIAEGRIGYLTTTGKAADSAKLDGKTYAQVIAAAQSGYLTTSGKAADSFKLEGLTKAQVVAESRAGLLTTSGKAADSDKLGGLQATGFARSQGRVVANFNDYRSSGMYGINNLGTNGTGESHGSLIVAANVDTGLQISGGHTNDDLYFRGWSGSGSAFTAWRRILHNGNYNDYVPSKTGEGASGNWSINIAGVSGAATKLAAARTISLSGDATGSTTFDGSGNSNIAVDVLSSNKLTNARTIGLGGHLSGSANFDGSGNITIVGTVGKDSHIHTFLEGFYTGGGRELPSWFGGARLKLNMLGQGGAAAGSTLGGLPGSTYSDALWLSGYSGDDVSISNLLVMSKGGAPKIGFRQQAHNATTWGEYHDIYHTGNKPSATDVGALPLGGGTLSGTLTARYLGRNNHGHGLVGLYSDKVFQNVFSMGNAYTCDENGATLANGYGIYWTHSNHTNSEARKINGHHAIFATAGKTKSAIGDHIWTAGNLYGTDINPSGIINVEKDKYIDFAANGVGGVLRVGGRGKTNALSPVNAAISVSNGNLNIDAGSDKETAINYNSGTGGVKFGNGMEGIIGIVDNVGNMAMNGKGSFKSLTIRGHEFINSSDTWIRTAGTDGIYFSGGGGGFHMTDGLWIRTFGGKQFHVASTANNAIDTAGGISAGQNITAYSDERIKTDITVIDNALDKISKIRGVTYTRTDIDHDHRHTGVIAQELRKVLPEAVIENESKLECIEDGKLLSVAYGNVVGLLIEGIKEEKSKRESLDTELTQVKTELSDLRKMVMELMNK